MSFTIPQWEAGRGIPASPEFPAMNNYRLGLLAAFHENSSYYEIWVRLKGLISRDDFIDDNVQTDTTAISILLDHTKDWVMLSTLHGIPRQVMGPILLGTIAAEFHPSRPRAQRPITYNGDGPGIYIAQISIEGRQGRGLNCHETESLVSWLLTYVYVFEQFEKNPDASLSTFSPKEKSRFEKVASIDSQYGLKPSDMPKLQPRFISGPVACRRLRRMIHMLQSRCAVARGGSDADREAWQISLPSMVGCADNINERAVAHHPNPARSDSLVYTTYTFGLVLCVLKEMDLTPEVTTVPVLRVWDYGQLRAAEMLVTLLASSLISQDGYNVVQGGNRVGRGVGPDDRNYVLANCPFLRENLEATRHNLYQRSAFLQATSDANHGGFQAKFTKLKNDLSIVEDKLSELDILLDQVRADTRKIELETAEIERQNRLRAETIALMSQLTSLLDNKKE
ncbi:hypothetical protein GGS24DRAFT_440675 [Hypoxylon argillaceum]|nr:hypothetical protein GGS24DRAFT_440675 [Hypoxylon argillaceum]